ncbi:MAG: tetratricopeptide repeat protein [Acidobacteriia bacterium]|nr:tetratricopeptide repeat protein [Terriglobia bacterium]
MKQRTRFHARQPASKTAAPPTRVQRYSRPEWLVVLAALVCDLNSWGHQFLMDDTTLIVTNPAIRTPGQILHLFTSPFLSLPNGAPGDLYRPVTGITLAVNYWIGGAHPDGFHLFNRLLHILVCLGIFWTVRRLVPRPPHTALVSSLVFAVHPIQTEAITYISGRADALAMLFLVFAWYYFIRQRSGEVYHFKFHLVSLLFYSLGLLSKENVITLLGILVLTEWIYFSRGNLRDLFHRLKLDFWRVYAGYLGVTITFLAVRWAVVKGFRSTNTPFPDNPLAYTPFFARAMTAAKILLQSIGLFLWPGSLSSDYSFNQIPVLTQWSTPAFWIVLALTAALVFILVWSYKRFPALFFGLAFFGITYSIVSNIIIPIGTIRADRLMYLPALGLCILVGVGWGRLYESAQGKLVKGVLWAILGAVLVLYCGRTVIRNRDWTDALVLSIHDIKVSPKSGKLQNNLGALYYQTGQYSLAMQHYRIAESIMPDSAPLLTNLGIILKQQGRLDEAVTYLRRAVSLAPRDTRTRNVLGVALQKQGDLSGAIDAFDTVLGQDPGNADAHFGKGYVLHKQGKRDEAIREYLRTLEIDPTNQGARNNLNLLLQNSTQPGSPQNSPANTASTQSPRDDR